MFEKNKFSCLRAGKGANGCKSGHENKTHKEKNIIFGIFYVSLLSSYIIFL